MLLLLCTAFASDVLFDRKSPYGMVRVVADSEIRTLEIDGHPQSAWAPGEPTRNIYAYTAAIEALLPEETGRALVIGLGGGTLPRHLDARGWVVDAVEIDPVVVRAARRFFALPGRVRVHVQDGRDFVRRESSWDLIILDAASEAGFAPTLFTRSFYEDLTRRGDRILVNSWASAPWAAHEVATWSAVVPVSVVAVEGAGNRILVVGDPMRAPVEPGEGVVLTEANVDEFVAR